MFMSLRNRTYDQLRAGGATPPEARIKAARVQQEYRRRAFRETVVGTGIAAFALGAYLSAANFISGQSFSGQGSAPITRPDGTYGERPPITEAIDACLPVTTPATIVSVRGFEINCNALNLPVRHSSAKLSQ